MRTLEYRVGQELPSLSFVWYDSTGAVEDLSSGWTGSVKLAHADAPTTLLLTLSSSTMGSTSPNQVQAIGSTSWSSLVTAWGGTLGATGEFFYAYPHLVRTSDSADRVWPDDPVRILLRPAVA